MLLEIITPPARRNGRTRAFVPYLILLALIPGCLPLHASEGPTQDSPAIVVTVPAEVGESLKPGEEVVLTLDVTDKAKTPDALEVEDRPDPTPVARPGSSRAPMQLAAAGLLLLPLDEGLLDVISRDHGGESSDDVTKALNKLGAKEVLAGIIGGIYVLGDKDDKETSKLAFAALVNAGMMTEGLKNLTGRARPDVSGGETVFTGPGFAHDDYKSFPSGHTAAAFAVATVLAERHPKQKWLYYGLATAVGIARIRKSAHFPSDVLVGAAVGIYNGNQALRRGPRILSIML